MTGRPVRAASAKTMPKPSTSRPPQARARGTGEDVGGLQPQTQLPGRNLAGQVDALRHAGGGRPAAQLPSQAAAAHQGEAHVAQTVVERGQRLDQRVLALARHQPADTEHKWLFAETERGARRRASAARVWA